MDLDADTGDDTGPRARGEGPDEREESKDEGAESEESDDEAPGGISMEPTRPRPAEVDPETAPADTRNNVEPVPIVQRGIYDASEPLYKPPVVSAFGGSAGKVYEINEIKGENLYQQMIGDQGNVYAPFSCKTDWDIAKWAKLRGPSSTAFTDLMKIEGVSCSSNIQGRMTHMLSRLQNVCSFRSNQQMSSMLFLTKNFRVCGHGLSVVRL